MLELGRIAGEEGVIEVETGHGISWRDDETTKSEKNNSPRNNI